MKLDLHLFEIVIVFILFVVLFFIKVQHHNRSCFQCNAFCHWNLHLHFSSVWAEKATSKSVPPLCDFTHEWIQGLEVNYTDLWLCARQFSHFCWEHFLCPLRRYSPSKRHQRHHVGGLWIPFVKLVADINEYFYVTKCYSSIVCRSMVV